MGEKTKSIILAALLLFGLGLMVGWLVGASSVQVKPCSPCSHSWSCVSFKNGMIDNWDTWTFRCSGCGLWYVRDRESICEAEIDLIEQWCGLRPERVKSLLDTSADDLEESREGISVPLDLYTWPLMEYRDGAWLELRF